MTYVYGEIRVLGVAPRLEIIDTIATVSTFEWKLSDGRTISYAREPIDIGTLAFSYRVTDNGKYFYEYCLDNRQIQRIRIGGVGDTIRLAAPNTVEESILSAPDGWTGFNLSWSPSLTNLVTRSETAKYTILSDYLAGPVILHVAGENKVRDDFKMPLFDGRNLAECHLMQEIHGTISLFGTSVESWVIGPAFKRRPSEREVRDRIHELVDRYGFEFLRPLDDSAVNMIEAAAAAVPETEFEVQILDSLKVAIRAMMADDQAAPGGLR
jgi:hypothetical protein